jgi:hypothetical protein
MKGGRFEFTHDKTTSLAVLARIANDLASRNVVLGDIWDVDGKQEYLNKLEDEGLLPEPARVIPKDDGPKLKAKPSKLKPSARVTPTVRTTLIPQKEFGLTWPGRLQRHHQIWEELQFHLTLRTHPNAVSVLLRVLLELALENYITEAGVTVHENDKLATKLEKAGLHLQAAGKIDIKQMDVIRKFKQGDKLVSADTLNKYVHSPNFAPSPEHLMSMWDSLADVVVQFLQT